MKFPISSFQEKVFYALAEKMFVRFILKLVHTLIRIMDEPTAGVNFIISFVERKLYILFDTTE